MAPVEDKYTIVATHPDDEFIGCRQFILANKDNISNVIFMTNGEFSVYGYKEPSFAYQRRKESEGWLKHVLPRVNIYYMNMPDAVPLEHLDDYYGKDLFYQEHGLTRTAFLQKAILSIAKDTIVVFNGFDNHPSHTATWYICYKAHEGTSKPIIQYYVHKAFTKTEQEPGVAETKQPKSIQILYDYIYTEEEYAKKLKEFELYYVSQYEDFKKSNWMFGAGEYYLSETPINLEIK